MPIPTIGDFLKAPRGRVACAFNREEFDLLIAALDILNGSYCEEDRDRILAEHDHRPDVRRLLKSLTDSAGELLWTPEGEITNAHGFDTNLFEEPADGL